MSFRIWLKKERQPVEQQHHHKTPAQARQADYGPWEFQSEKWELAYIKRIAAAIAALKSAGVPVIWVSVRPMAGPVVPLTGANVGSEQVLLGGPDESPGATVGLSTEAVAAPSGRADDFGWPRGVVNVEPAVVEPAPDTAAEDVGVKSAKAPRRKSAMDAYAAQAGREHKSAQRRPLPRLEHNVWAHQRPNFPSFGASGW